jgi:hypothetical protein
VIIEVNQGVCVSQSNITGNFILSDRAAASSEDSLMNNRTVMNNKQSVSADVPRKIDDQDELGVQRNQSLGAQKKQSSTPYCQFSGDHGQGQSSTALSSTVSLHQKLWQKY